MTVSSSSFGNSRPRRLPSEPKQKVWGSKRLAPWFPDQAENIGEIWFQADLPLLVKFIFTEERLSVQVHPDDAFAAQHEASRGKTEMWHILRADPGAQIALGFRQPLTRERVRQAALSGEIMQLLNWIDVKPGDTFFTPAGTVHAIGAGLALCEIQQRSDVTYRLYDYGRPRELHLEKALQVCRTDAHAATGCPLPVECDFFRTELLEVHDVREHEAAGRRAHMLIVLEGEGRLAGQTYRAGEAWHVPPTAPKFAIHPEKPTRLLLTWEPK